MAMTSKRAILAALACCTVFWPAAPSSDTWVGGSWRDRHAVPADDEYKSPIQLAISRDGKRLYVVCENTDEVLVVNPKSGKVEGSVGVGDHPFGLASSSAIAGTTPSRSSTPGPCR
jgi:YVTN family beta-propeller protein